MAGDVIWPFRRRGKLIPCLPTETWRIGDIAECIAPPFLWGREARHAPAFCSRLLVIGVDRGAADDRVHEIIGLHLAGFPHRWDARGFRKIVLTDVAGDRRVDRRVEERA